MNTRAEIARAGEYLRRGALADAERLLRGVISANPADADALHLLGLVRKQAGDPSGALALLLASVDRAPRRPDFQGNLGNLLRGLGRGAEAEAAYRAALAADPTFRAGRLGLARLLVDLQRPAEAEAEARRLVAQDARDAEAWAALGAARSALERHADAEAAYRQALQLRPGYAVAHHNLGALLSRMQRAEEAIEQLDKARKAGIVGRELEFNRARTLFDLYRFDEADEAAQRAVTIAPLDLETQVFLAKLRHMRGDAGFLRSIEDAVTRYPAHVALRMTLADLARRSGQLQRAETELREIIERNHVTPDVSSALGTVLQEQRRFEEAEPWARRALEGRPDSATFIEGLVVVLLALGRATEALPLIERGSGRAPLDQRWLTHRAIAMRLLGDPEYTRLFDYERFVRPLDLEPPAGWSSIESLHQDLLPVLAERHRFETHPLDQSLRHGTQTARSLLADPHPVLRALLTSLDAAVAEYCRQIGHDASHPYLCRNIGATRMAGCWSVRLRRGGYHVNHIHPAGWISSAYYVQVPAEVADTTLKSGWIKFGEPYTEVPGATAERFVQPREGRLVLFPSYMWHGTTAIAGDDPRITVAFDVLPA